MAKPSKGTAADRRLKANKSKAVAAPKGLAAPFSKGKK